jgi:hypothetical protein
MKHLTFKTKTHYISTIKITDIVHLMDAISGNNPDKFEYETIVFNCPDFDAVETKRYNSEEDAKNGHKLLVAKYRKRGKNE